MMTRALCVVIWLAACGGESDHETDAKRPAETTTSPAPSPTTERVGLLVRSVGSDARGASSTISSAGADLAVGDTATTYLALGSSPNDLCGGNVGTLDAGDDAAARRAEQLASGARHVWWTRYRLVSFHVDRVELELTWEHVVVDSPQAPRVVAGDTRTLVLREGDVHLLDAVTLTNADPDPDPDRGCSRVAAIEVGFDVEEDPALAGEWLTYELWWQHTDAAGRSDTRRIEHLARQGDAVTFQFMPRRYPVGHPALDGILDVFGTLRGRARRDGSVEVKLAVERYTDVELAGTPRRGGIGDGGAKLFHMRAGETVRMDLPAIPTGKNGATTPDGSTHYGDNAKLYAGHSDALFLRARRGR